MKHILIFIAFILFLLAGIAGIQTWLRTDTSVGYFKIGKNPYGVAIYQDGAHDSVQFAGAKDFKINATAVTILNPKTIMYGRDDIIFGADGTIYTEPTQDQIDYLTATTGRPFQKVTTSDRKITLPAQTLYIVNPHIPGTLEVKIYGTGLMGIDRDLKQIGNLSEQTVTVTVHDSISL